MKQFVFLCIASALLFTACQKEYNYTIDNGTDNGGTDSATNSLKGSWNFTSLSSQQNNTSELNFENENDKTVTLVSYKSTNNTGTLTIDDSVFNSTDFNYTISTTTKSYSYQNGVLLDSFNIPFTTTITYPGSVAKYKLISADSVYFPEGGFVFADTTSAVKPYGLTYKISGSNLTFTQQIYLDTITVASGISNHIISTGTGSISFQRK